MTPQRPRAALLAVAAVCLTAPPGGLPYAAAKDAPAPKATSAALDVVPADGLMMTAIRVGDYRDHPLSKAGRTIMEIGAPEAFKTFHSFFGVDFNEVDQIIVFMPWHYGSHGAEGLFVVRTIKPYEKTSLLGPAAATDAEEEINDRTLYRNQRGMGYTLLDDNTFLAGRADQVTTFLKRKKSAKEGPLTPALKLAADKHFAVMGWNMAALAAKGPPSERTPPEMKPFNPLLKAKYVTVTVDLDEQLKADAKATFANEADAKDGTAAADAGLDLIRGGFVQWMKQFSRQFNAPKTAALLKDAQAVLGEVKAEQEGSTVEVAAALKIDPKAMAAAEAEAALEGPKAAKRRLITNQFRQLGIAAQSYHDAMGRLPSAAIYDKNGKPLLSWRVLLLPYLEEGNLYQQFHLDEPWDSEHNIKLLDKMPQAFGPKDAEAFNNHETFYQAFVGKGSVFEPPVNPQPGPVANGFSFAAIGSADGMSRTILFVEAKKAVPWTKPDDIVFDDGKLLPKVGGLSKGGFMAVLCDGSVPFVPLTVKEDTLRVWILRNSGQEKPTLDE